MAESVVITPEIDIQRVHMEEQLVKMGLVGVGMPPDGSCLLHCIIYGVYPLQCLKDYPAAMTVVNVGAADGMVPRRVAADQFLRVKLMEYALKHNFQIDPVVPVEGLPSVREGSRRTITLGYLTLAYGLAGHYICTREQRDTIGIPRNSFACGSYRGSIHIGPPKSMSCGNNRRFERIPEQRVE
ncbi:hypothetical protein PsorP6_017327 [Peronosclerospora sorghi]|uniref:Uncharacterized protein n=1 Tax=Peronosclerospora sorghi TaxID=230839 RepID=A0ACC0WPJ6_9STRA|nr:hypothetical protein PsorP6_017327 [Peronosclerospora sorghi]